MTYFCSKKVTYLFVIQIVTIFLFGQLKIISGSADVGFVKEEFTIEYKKKNALESDQPEIIHIRTVSSPAELYPPHSCFEATRDIDNENITLCYPLIIVAGVFKCGTSALFQLLDQHDRIYGGHIKENCIDVPFYNDHEDALWRFLQSLKRQTIEAIEVAKHTDKQQTLLSGSMNCHDHHAELLKLNVGTMKNILMIRNYSDWTWSAFNFYFVPRLEKKSGMKMIGKYHHEEYVNLFHKLVEASIAHSESVDGVNLTDPDFKELMNYFHYPMHYFQRKYTELINLAQDRKSVYLTNNELMSEDPKLFWKKLIQFLDFKPYDAWASHPLLHSWENRDYRVNAGDQPGEGNISNSTHVPGTYRRSGFRPLLNKTIALLDSMWYEECLWAFYMTEYKYKCFKGD